MVTCPECGHLTLAGVRGWKGGLSCLLFLFLGRKHRCPECGHTWRERP